MNSPYTEALAIRTASIGPLQNQMQWNVVDRLVEDAVLPQGSRVGWIGLARDYPATGQIGA